MGPRMADATRDVPVAARMAGRRASEPNGWWGMLLLIGAEATLFASLIASYFYLRFQDPAWPPAGVEPPHVALPLALTGALLCSALPVVAAARAAGRGAVRRASWLIAAALAIQGAYLGLQIHLLAGDLHSFSPTASAYGSIYFTLLGVHHAHVAAGLALSLWLEAALARGLTRYRLVAMRAIALYWCFVALVAVPVVLTQLYPSL